jgi:small subunit ribosomal protein S13
MAYRRGSRFSVSESYRHIVRIFGTDLDGSRKLLYGLSRVKGVNVNLAQASLKSMGLDPNMRLGYLTEADVEKIEEFLRNPSDKGIPGFLVNRRKDLETGHNIHLIGPDLTLRLKSDIDFMKNMKSWKGIRHSLGLKVRGQRTKTTGRSGRVVGVKKQLLKAAAAAREGGKEAKKGE